MALLCDYFTADSQDDAALTIDWIGGPSQPPLPPKGLRWRVAIEGLATVHAPDIDPVVMMSALEHLLVGGSLDDLVTENAHRQVVSSPGGERMVFKLSDRLVSALSESDPDRLRTVSVPWSQTEEFGGLGDLEVLTNLLRELAALARQVQTSGGLYCWMCP
jgi:hypothetical protein